MNDVPVPPVTEGGPDAMAIHQRIPVQSFTVNTSSNTVEVEDATGNIKISLTFPNQNVLDCLSDAMAAASAATAQAHSNQNEMGNHGKIKAMEKDPKPIKLEYDSGVGVEEVKAPNAVTATTGKRSIAPEQELESRKKHATAMDSQTTAKKSNIGFTTMPRRVSTSIGSLSTKVASTKTGDDVYGRAPGLFALKNNCVYESNLFLPTNKYQPGGSFPIHVSDHFFQNENRFQRGKRNYAERFANRIQSGEKKAVTKTLWNKQNQFATMPKGSIVCMVLGNAPGYQDICFGTIQSKNDFSIKTREDLKGVPVPTDHGGLEDTFLYHRVKWVCHAKMKDLPGQEVNFQGAAVVPWINNNSPFTILELKNADDFMKMDKFKECISKDFTDLLEDADEMLAS
ncbi:MAG: hypothetical protein SGARI_003322 [Bacillariaceae sp.]